MSQNDQSNLTNTLTDVAYLGFVVMLLLVCCFPVGLWLVATHPTWSRAAKLLAAGAWAGLMALGFYADWIEKHGSKSVRHAKIVQAYTADAGHNGLVRAKLAQWKRERQKLMDALAKLKAGRQQIVEAMRDTGDESPAARVYAEEILELDAQINLLTERIESYDTVIAKAESAFRRIERRKLIENVGLTEAELNELAMTVHELDESLQRMTGETVTLELDVDGVLRGQFDSSRSP